MDQGAAARVGERAAGRADGMKLVEIVVGMDDVGKLEVVVVVVVVVVVGAAAG